MSGENLMMAAIFLFVLVVAALQWLAREQAKENAKEAWSEMGKNLGLDDQPLQDYEQSRLAGTYRNHRLECWRGSEPRGRKRNPRIFTGFQLDIDLSWEFDMRLSLRDSQPLLGSHFRSGADPVEISTDLFNAHVLAAGSWPDDFEDHLRTAQVQESLIQVLRFVPFIDLQTHQITVEIDDHFEELDDLMSRVDCLLDFARLLRPNTEPLTERPDDLFPDLDSEPSEAAMQSDVTSGDANW